MSILSVARESSNTAMEGIKAGWVSTFLKIAFVVATVFAVASSAVVMVFTLFNATATFDVGTGELTVGASDQGGFIATLFPDGFNSEAHTKKSASTFREIHTRDQWPLVAGRWTRLTRMRLYEFDEMGRPRATNALGFAPRVEAERASFQGKVLPRGYELRIKAWFPLTMLVLGLTALSLFHQRRRILRWIRQDGPLAKRQGFDVLK